MRAIAAPSATGAPLAVVIPALNEAEHLPALLADLATAPTGLVESCMVVDGGSHDGSPRLSALAGARVQVGLNVSKEHSAITCTDRRVVLARVGIRRSPDT